MWTTHRSTGHRRRASFPRSHTPLNGAKQHRVLIACARATALPLGMTIWTRGLEVVAFQYVLTSSIVWLGLIAERLLLDRVVERVAPHRRQVAPTLFVGVAGECRTAAASPAF